MGVDEMDQIYELGKVIEIHQMDKNGLTKIIKKWTKWSKYIQCINLKSIHKTRVITKCILFIRK